jgi:uncharacterized tellurite resistance protein B-like protein
MMLRKLFNSFMEKPSGAQGVDMQTAICALLVEAAGSDQTYTDKERRLIERAVSAHFDISGDAAFALREKAETAQRGANDVHRFTKIAKTMNQAGKEALIASLWRIVLSDGERTPYEDALIRQICGLIYFPDVENGRIRLQIEAELANNKG